MTLQHFQPKARITGDKMDLRNYYGRPLLVRVNEFVPDFSSQQYPTPKPVVFVDVVDLVSGQIFINALWGGGAVVDNLREHAGTQVVLPLMAQSANGGQGRTYIALVGMDENTAAQAGQWHQQFWGTVEQAREQRMQQAAAAQPAPVQAAQPVQQTFQPVAQPQQGFAPAAAPAQQFQPAPVQQGFAPAQAAPVQQGFGQPQPGMFSDAQPAAQPGQGFGQPQAGVDPAAAQAALQQLNGQLG